MSLIAKQERPHLPAGTLLDDRFEIVEWLGGGSFGDVYHARQMVLGRPLRSVALKLFDSARVTATNVRDVFSDAITLIGLQEENPSQIVSRHMIQVYDIGAIRSPEERAFMSMRLIPGGKTLDDAIRRFSHDGMPVSLALRFLRQILIALEWMHALDTPIVHGDLKPDNILLTDESNLILTDFGLAAPLPLGSLGGAVSYQAPETLLGSIADSASDIYALGLVWYEMLTGMHPFREVGLEALADDDSKQYIRAHQEARKWKIRPANTTNPAADLQRIAPASEINSELLEHPQLEAILERCLTWTHAQRFANAGLLRTEIDTYLATGRISDASAIVLTETARDELEEPRLLDKSPEARVKDAEMLLSRSRPDAALAQIDLALKQQPSFVPAILVQVRAHVACRHIDLAKQSCAKAQQLAPEMPEVFEAMADVFQAEGRQTMAQNMRRQAQNKRLQSVKKSPR